MNAGRHVFKMKGLAARILAMKCNCVFRNGCCSNLAELQYDLQQANQEETRNPAKVSGNHNHRAHTFRIKWADVPLDVEAQDKQAKLMRKLATMLKKDRFVMTDTDENGFAVYVQQTRKVIRTRRKLAA